MSAAFDLPRDVILPVRQIDVRLDDAPHPFEVENAEAAQQNWVRELAAQPSLFDGTVMLLSSLAYDDGRLVGRAHAVRYSTFLLWRRSPAVSMAEHCFAHAVLVSADNALVAIRMAATTVNAGRVYFAAGSFEPCDFFDGQVDVDANMRREVAEETGLDLSLARAEASLFALSTKRGTALFRRYRLDEPAHIVAERIGRFVEAQDDPEIEGAVILLGDTDLPDELMPHMKPLIGWHFRG